MLTRSAGQENLAGGFSAFDLSARKTVLAAVSGGSDSLALLLLLESHLQRTAPAAELAAVTIDHALREESAAEAERVAKFCAARGISHRILRWEGDKPRTGISAAAREARHRLLAQAARSFGTDLVLTGHTLDDQAETVLMRKARGEGRGLAGIAPATLYDEKIWIGRPLLGLGRETLRGYLRNQGAEWIDDPSNENFAYERVRARREIAENADPEALKHDLVAQAAEAAAARIALGEQATELVRGRAEKVSPGLYRLSPDFAAGDFHASLHALRLLLAAIGGRDHLPDEARAADLLAKLRHEPCRATLSGVAIDARKSGIFLRREFRGEGPAAIAVAGGAIWDGRYRILADGDPAGFLVAPLGRARAAEAAISDDAPAPASLIRAALAAQPAFSPSPSASRTPLPHFVRERTEQAGRLSSPSSGGEVSRRSRDGEGEDTSLSSPTLTPLVAPYARFLPSFDLAPAQALAALLGAPPFPKPPFSGRDRG